MRNKTFIESYLDDPEIIECKKEDDGGRDGRIKGVKKRS